MSLVANTLFWMILLPVATACRLSACQRESDILALGRCTGRRGDYHAGNNLAQPLGNEPPSLLLAPRTPGLCIGAVRCWMGGSFSRYWMRARRLLLTRLYDEL